MTGQATPALSVALPATRAPQQSSRFRAGEDPGGVVAARRLVRDIESLESSLAAAELAAAASRPTGRGFSVSDTADVDSRRAELDRWETELQDRERIIERQRTRLEQIQVRLHRAKDSLKRAIFRFHSEVADRTDQLDARARQLGETQAELVESRRVFARELIRHKADARKLPV